MNEIGNRTMSLAEPSLSVVSPQIPTSVNHSVHKYTMATSISNCHAHRVIEAASPIHGYAL